MSGLAFSRRYSSIISFWSVSRSPLCFSCSDLICGASACIARCDLICLTNTGNSAVRMVSTRKTMARTQSQFVTRNWPPWKAKFHSACHWSRIQEIPQ